MLMGMELPLPAIRSQIASGIDILVHLGRLRDKSRKVLNITEVIGVVDGEVQMQELFRFVEEGSEKGKIRGTLIRVAELQHVDKCQMAGYQVEEMQRGARQSKAE